MKRLSARVCVAGALAFAIAAGLHADLAADIHSDTQLRAMADELARSRTLHLNDLEKPYFVSYAVSDIYQRYVGASLGGLTASTSFHVRSPRVVVRVGDYNFDNSNSVYSSVPRAGMFPVDDDYGVMRTVLWLGADTVYKNSADQIARKRAALREIAEPDKTPDLAPAKPVQLLRAAERDDFDRARWERVMRDISARFAAYPGVTTSAAQLRTIHSTYRFVNTEGTVVRVPQDATEIEMRASALASNGAEVWNHRFFTALTADQMPDAAALQRAAETLAAETEAAAKAHFAEPYSGPVLFEQEAAAEMIASVLSDALRLERRPITAPGSNERGTQPLESVWASRLGAQVAPEWISTFDDPREREFHGTPLAGHYEVDDEGVPAQRVDLVEKGTLRGFLFSREPVRTFDASNGHGRLPGAWATEQPVIGNLFVEAAHPIPEAQLKARLIEKAKAAGLAYGIVIRRIDFPSTADFEQLQTMARQLQKSGFSRTLNAPLVAARVYPDGREEPVCGLRFQDFSAKELRDLEAASDTPYVLNYLNNGSSFNLAGAGSNITTSTVVSPSLLFTSLDLDPVQEEPGKPPIVPPPPASGMP